MDKLKALDESQYKVDFMISDGYIKFSGELLRLSLLAMGGFGTLVLLRIKGDDKMLFLEKPGIFIVSMLFFALCSAASLFHRFYASDAMSWYISWLRAENEGDAGKSATERSGFHKKLKRASQSLVLCEWLFGAGVLFFILAVIALLAK